MSKFLVLSIFILSAFSNVLASESFQKDCQEVGDYIHKNAGKVHNALYVLYNGTGEKKAHTFEKVFQYNSYRHNRQIGWGVEKRSEYLNKNFLSQFEYLKVNEGVEKDFIKSRIKQRSFKHFKNEERAFNLFFSRYYCRKLIGENIRSCRRNMKRLFKLVKVQRLKKGEEGSVTSLSLPDLLVDVLSSSSHLKLSYKAVNSLLPSAVNKEYKSKTNIFELLSDKSQELILTKEKAEELVWDTLGAYATRGASFEGYSDHLFTSKNIYHFSLLYELFNLIHVYDSKRTPEQGQFSLPTFKKNSCQFGKSYHFWMAAYLSRYLVKRGLSKKEAFQASFAMGVLYDFMGSGAPQRERVRVINEGMDSIYVRSIFQSVLFKSLGAMYGVAPQKISQINVNELYEKMRSSGTDYRGRVYMKESFHMKNLPAFIQKLGLKSLLHDLSQKL